MSVGAAPLRLLHVAPCFAADAEGRRIAALVHHFGANVEHAFAVPAPQAWLLGAELTRSVRYTPLTWPELAGGAGPIRSRRLAEAMRGYDLVLTYGWGAIDAALAHTAFAARLGLGPLVHHEHHLEPDEVERRRTRRNLRRMLALARVAAVVVPTQRLQTIASAEWKVPPGKVRRIDPGTVTAPGSGKPRRDALPRVVKQRGELFLGTLAGEADEADLLALLRAFVSLPEPWQLVILGHTAAGEAILDEAVRLSAGHRVHLTGPLAEPGKAFGLCDLFAWLGGAQGFPAGLTEAMAAGLAVAGWNRGDAAAVVADDNRRFLVRPGDEVALTAALAQLAGDGSLRDSIAGRNRDEARASFGRAAMLAAYEALYAQVLGRERLR
jgi:glycosyltransferase involved in cell wall biosynthesis